MSFPTHQLMHPHLERKILNANSKRYPLDVPAELRTTFSAASRSTRTQTFHNDSTELTTEKSTFNFQISAMQDCTTRQSRTFETNPERGDVSQQLFPTGESTTSCQPSPWPGFHQWSWVKNRALLISIMLTVHVYNAAP